jgi:hypothetical protein
MRKALIPALFVVCGALTSKLWSDIGISDAVCQAEIFGAVATPLLTCVGTELLAREVTEPALHSAALQRVDIQNVRNDLASFLLEAVQFQLQQNGEK